MAKDWRFVNLLFVQVDELKTGMRLGKPIYNKSGVLLYDRDTRLTSQAIYGIKNFGLMGLYILEPAEPLPPMSEDDINFERFQTMAVFSIREDLELIAAGKRDKGLDWLCSLVIKNYGDLGRKINFVQSLRSNEDFVYKHVLNVSILAAIIAGQMGLPLGRINALVKAAVLHDIGALEMNAMDIDESDNSVRMTIQRNSMDALHRYGEVDDDIMKLILSLHVLYGREGDTVPEEVKNNANAKILYVADAYDRMTAMKSYEEPTSEVEAIRTLLANPDRYDANIVNALIKAINILTPGVCIELTNGMKGLVIAENEVNVFEPLVLCFSDNKIYDLSSPSVKEKIQIKDVMKTMDNRIKLDSSLLEEYSNISLQ